MNDAELKAIINTRKNTFQYGDYVRIKAPGYASGEIRMLHKEQKDVYSDSVACYGLDNRWVTWKKFKLEHATREEYVAFMQHEGLVPRNE